MVRSVRELNWTAIITVRARYLSERDALTESGANHVVMEEGEAGVAMAHRVLSDRGIPADRMNDLLEAIRRVWRLI